MKHLSVLGILMAFLFSGCALKKDAVRNAKNIQHLQQQVNNLRQQQAKTSMKAEYNSHKTQRNFAIVAHFWRQLLVVNKFANEAVEELRSRNAAVGLAVVGHAYFIFLGEYYHMLKMPRFALFYYNQGVRLLEREMKANNARCKYMSCVKWLSLGRYNRACIYAAHGKTAKALQDLRWLDITDNMKFFVQTKRQFWQDPDFRPLQNVFAYQQLVAKWKAWLASQPKPKVVNKKHGR